MQVQSSRICSTINRDASPAVWERPIENYLHTSVNPIAIDSRRRYLAPVFSVAGRIYAASPPICLVARQRTRPEFPVCGSGTSHDKGTPGMALSQKSYTRPRGQCSDLPPFPLQRAVPPASGTHACVYTRVCMSVPMSPKCVGKWNFYEGTLCT